MAAARRLAQELKDMKTRQLLHSIKAEETNLFVWQGLILPSQAPYNTGAFRVELNFPPEYPFKPPKVTFKTKIYHPNIDENGQVCLPIISPENWKPATRTNTVLQRLLEVVNEPQMEHPLRPELVKEFTEDRAKFLKHAAEQTKKHSEPRPE